MRNVSNNRSRLIVLSSVALVLAAVGFACSSEEENPATQRNRGTSSSSGGTSSGAATSGGTSGAPAGAPLCGKYGGVDNVKSIASQIVATAKTDCRISPRITAASADLENLECWSIFVQGSFLCPGVSFTAGTTKRANGETCNSRFPGLDLTKADFDQFMLDIRDALKAKTLTDDDVRAILPAFEGARQDLTGGSQENLYSQCAATCQVPDAQKCIRPILDAGNDGPRDAGVDARDAADQ
jgi:hypothetical protein